MEEGQIAKWHVKEGDHVEAGTLLFEVSTDKATVEHTALDEGWLKSILVKEGESTGVNAPVAVFTEEESESIEGYQPEGIMTEAVKEEKKKSAPKLTKKAPPMPAAPQKAVASTTGGLKASPLAKRLAEEKGVDLSSVAGSGPGGRVLSRDLEFSHAPKKRAHKAGTYKEVPLTPVRRVIADRLLEAKSTIPHFYVTRDVNAEELVVLREQLKAGGVKLTYNDFVVKAAALALTEHPDVNVSFDAENEVIKEYLTVDISVAVTTPEGLITPIVTHADEKHIQEISQEIKALAKKAKEGKLLPEEFQGGSFTVSNMGMYDVKDFAAIINPPQAAILAVGGIREEAVVIDGEVVAGQRMSLTVSCDHRVVDGTKAASFLKTLAQLLEHPALLLL